MKKRILALIISIVITVLATGCSEAERVSYNLS